MNLKTSAEPDLDPVNMLKWYVECGVDETISETPINWFEQTDNVQTILQVMKVSSPAKKPVSRPAATAPLASQKDLVSSAEKAAAQCTTLDELNQAILSFEGCSLKNTASNTVFSDGNPASEVMLIGEAPGAEEDKIGKPFVGQAGQLLDRMFGAINMKRETDFYITNVLPWRPPGNRKPTDAECELCLPFLKRHIELVGPKMIILIGGTSASTVLNVQTGITKLRGKWHDYKGDETQVPLMAIFHPAYLLRQPHYKKQTWHDLLAIKEKFENLSK